MERFSGRDIGLLREFLYQASVPCDLSTFAGTLMPAIQQLVPGEIVCHAQVDPVRGRVVTQLVHPVEGSALMDKAAFERHMMEHPVFVHWAANGATSAARTSDFVNRSRWQETPLYREVYKAFDCNDSLAVSLPAPPGLVACFCIERKVEFTDREKALMDFVRPHIVNGYRTAELFSLLGQANSEAGPHSVILHSNGAPQFVPAPTERLLMRYFPREGIEEGLPASLSDWVRSRLANLAAPDSTPNSSPWVVEGSDGSRLAVRLLVGHLTAAQALLLLHETMPPRVSARVAETYRLTRREVEVLTAAIRGLEPASIADELFISRRTVDKHLENIYSKLGVESRSAAVARALEG